MCHGFPISFSDILPELWESVPARYSQVHHLLFVCLTTGCYRIFEIFAPFMLSEVHFRVVTAKVAGVTFSDYDTAPVQKF